MSLIEYIIQNDDKAFSLKSGSKSLDFICDDKQEALEEFKKVKFGLYSILGSKRGERSNSLLDRPKELKVYVPRDVFRLSFIDSILYFIVSFVVIFFLTPFIFNIFEMNFLLKDSLHSWIYYSSILFSEFLSDGALLDFLNTDGGALSLVIALSTPIEYLIVSLIYIPLKRALTWAPSSLLKFALGR
ncbi:MAG: hypothetical protein COB02_03030 [Candidatus Cloacimonadota bacterium]|nr:MAG: hypothetical protein COB02_03030 [Candidatus Cloacimonadota bacterium]